MTKYVYVKVYFKIHFHSLCFQFHSQSVQYDEKNMLGNLGAAHVI